MNWVVLCREEQENEFCEGGVKEKVKINFIRDAAMFSEHTTADAWFDLQYENSRERNNILTEYKGAVIIGSVTHTIQSIGHSFTRINAWPGFLSAPRIEASGNKAGMEEIAGLWGKEFQWLPDEPGFWSARVVSMIINEAYLAYSEGLSSLEEIDIAMKLGTSYPFGPFEWSKMIGLRQIVELLLVMAIKQDRYKPCKAILEELSSN